MIENVTALIISGLLVLYVADRLFHLGIFDKLADRLER